MSEKDANPKEGDTYHCKSCDMSLLITTSCQCSSGDGAFFSCCGEQLERKSSSDDD